MCRFRDSHVLLGLYIYPMDSITLSDQMMIGVYNHLLSKVFRFHYHFQKVSQDP